MNEATLSLIVDREDATHRFDYGIDRKGARPGGPSRDFASYYFGSLKDAETFRMEERLHVGLPYVGGYEIISSNIVRLEDLA